MHRKVLVTGGSRGIGLAIARNLTQLGHQVTVTATKQSNDDSIGFDHIAVDFSNDAMLKQFVEYVSAQQFDIVINNAGINKVAPFSEISKHDFCVIQKVNLEAPFLISRAALPHMKEQRWGRIVNIASIFSKISKVFRASYSASKFALDGLTTALAVELAPYNVLANCVSPGFIDTDLTRQVLGEQGMQALSEEIPIKRLGTADEIAHCVAWLCSDTNTYLTGQNIVIDGGFTRV